MSQVNKKIIKSIFPTEFGPWGFFLESPFYQSPESTLYEGKPENPPMLEFRSLATQPS